MAAEITDTGVLIETLDQVEVGLNTEFFDEFGNAIDLSPQGYTGREIPIISRSIVQLQNLTADTITSLDIDSAQGRFLDNLGTLLDEPRKSATKSKVNAELTGAPNLDVGDKRVRYKRNDSLWRTPVGAVLGANGRLKTVLEAVETGVVQAFEDSTAQWVIVDEVSGWTFVESTADAIEGSPLETDPVFRERLKLAGKSSGVGTLPGVQRALRAVPGNVSARVLNNRNIAIPVNGVPGKRVEAVIEGGTDDDIGQAIIDSYGGTDGLTGSTEVSVPDAFGNPRIMRFTRLDRIDVIFKITVDTTGADSALPEDAASTMINVVADRTNALAEGVDVTPDDTEAVIRAAFESGAIPAGQVIVLIGLKSSGVVVPAPLVIQIRERARTTQGVQAGGVVGTETQTFGFIVTWQLQLNVDGGNVQQVTWAASDFADTGAATALEIATVINLQTTGLTSGSQNGALAFVSDTLGAASSITILPASTPALLTELGLTAGTFSGTDGDIEVTII